MNTAKENVVPLLLSFVFFGFLMVFAGVILLILAGLTSNGQPDFGGIIIIGPIPILIGYGQNAPWLIVFAAVLTLVCLLFFVLAWMWSRRG